MSVFYDVIKFSFFILTFIVWIFELRLKWVLSSSVVDIIWPFVLPVYMIFVGLMIGYIIGYILTQKRGITFEEKSYTQGFIIGWIIWLILAAIYYFM